MKIEKEELEKLGFNLIPAKDVSIEQVEDFVDEYVYDLEVDDNSHMFFANNILVHNSIYVRMDNILKLLFKKTNINWDDKATFEKIKDFVDNKFQNVLNKHVGDFICNRFKTDQRRIEFKREKISSEGEYLAKKRYVCHVRNDEGLDVDKFSYTGVDVAKNELPNEIKKLLKQCVEGMMKEDWDNIKFQDKIMEIYDVYCNLPIKSTAYIKNLNTPKESTGFLKMEKGAGVHARSAEMYNQLIEQMGLTNKYEKIARGDRFYYVYIKSNNKYGIDCIAWKDYYPKEFENLFEINTNLMFDKQVISPLKGFITNHKFASFDPNNIVIKGENGINLFDL
jgi:uncharacterized protein YaaR (DUF327 family)